MAKKKYEAKFHARLMTWLKHHKKLFPKSYLIETKVVRPGKKRFPLCELSEKERRLLKQAKHKQILQTHSDISMLGTNCDASAIGGGGYVFIHWVIYGNKVFYAIDIDILEAYEKDNKLKSLSEKDAEEISFVISELQT